MCENKDDKIVKTKLLAHKFNQGEDTYFPTCVVDRANWKPYKQVLAFSKSMRLLSFTHSIGGVGWGGGGGGMPHCIF